MNVIAISDLHGNLITSRNFQGDMLLIGGDITPFDNHNVEFQKNWFNTIFLPWLKYIKFKTIIFIAGNHDFYFETVNPLEIRNQLPDNVYYLQDDYVTIENCIIYGTPWIKHCGKWAFSASEQDLNTIYSKITPCNILLTHGPAFGYCDSCLQFNDPENLGSQELLKNIKLQLPNWVISGHIHSGSHVPINLRINSKLIKFVGVSYLNENMSPHYKFFKFTV